MSLYTFCFDKIEILTIRHAIEQEADKTLKMESSPQFPHQKQLDLQRLNRILSELDNLPICGKRI